jgi:hypothetical protein
MDHFTELAPYLGIFLRCPTDLPTAKIMGDIPAVIVYCQDDREKPHRELDVNQVR